MLYAAARTGLAELALSGCTTVFDHHYVFPRGVSGLVEAELRAAAEIGVRIVASRGSMDLGVSDGGLPPDNLVEQIDDVLADTERLAGLVDGAAAQIVVAPCSPFSVTTQLMEESAELARRLGLGLHTHLAETVEEEAVLQRALRLPARRVPGSGRLARRRRLVRALHPPLAGRGGAVRRPRRRRGALPDLEPPPRGRHRPGARARRRPGRRRARRRRVGVERAQRPLLRGEAGAARRARPRRRRAR